MDLSLYVLMFLGAAVDNRIFFGPFLVEFTFLLLKGFARMLVLLSFFLSLSHPFMELTLEAFRLAISRAFPSWKEWK